VLAAVTQSLAGVTQVVPVRGPVLNHFEGDIFTMRWTKDGIPMQTKLGLAVADGYGYSVLITLPEAERAGFSSLARQARVSSVI
jgi:hypothetical protein